MSQAVIQQYGMMRDGVFGWHAGRSVRTASGVVAHEVHFTSQVWKGIRWEHHLAVLVPENLSASGPALLLVTGGHHLYLSTAGHLAARTGRVVGVLYDVPNQPLFDGLVEDALLSYSLQRCLETGETDWPLLLPMVKSVVRGMDALEAFCAERGHAVTGFMVSGASKRGWTTWLTPVVDDRVRAIAPAVYDNLGLPAQMRHQVATWGEYSERIHDYTERGLPQLAADGRAREMLPLVDPYEHLDRITVPKLLIIGTNDRYWPLDALNLYANEIAGPTWFVYIPNVGHNAINTDRARNGLERLLLHVNGEMAMPTLRWHIEDGPAIEISGDPPPQSVRLWAAHRPDRDFRSALWNEVDSARGDTAATLNVPVDGAPFTAAFAEAAWAEGDRPCSLASNVMIYDREGRVLSAPGDVQ